MTEPDRGPTRPISMRLLVLLLAPLLLAACNAEPATDTGPQPAPRSTGTPPSPSASGPGRPGPGPAVVPHEDQGVARRGPVATRTERCVLDGRPAFSFDGTVTAIDDGAVTFDVNEWFSGDDRPATVVLEMAAPVRGRASETGPSYSVGTRMLVEGAGRTVWGCGRTVYYDEETAADRRS